MLRAFILVCLIDAAAYSALALLTQDKTFMTDIAHRGFEEIAMGKLAEKSARSPEVTSFAKQFAITRAKINDEAISLGAQKGVRIPTENLGVVIGHNPQLGALAYGAGFAGGPPGGVMSNYDKRWTSVMETTLRKDLTDCAEQAKNGSDADVKAWATKTFEVLRKDLLMLMDIRAKLK